MSVEDLEIAQKKSETILPMRHTKKLVFPRRKPSIIVPPRKIIFTTADKTTCESCPCYPKEDPYRKPKKLNPCQNSPPTLYKLAAKAFDNLKFPEALKWSRQRVADWIANEVGLPEYKECILDNHIDGMRLLMLEDPSKLPEINIRSFPHIQLICSEIRKLYKTEFIKYMRSLSLPPRKPLTHCIWFKSRSGPSWGIRQNWSRCDILRWMKVISPEPVSINHWDLVWYQKPDFPKVIFGRIPKRITEDTIPRYVPPQDEICREYMVPRKFRFQTGIPEEAQMIWMEKRPIDLKQEERERKKNMKLMKWPKQSRLDPNKIHLEGLRGKEFLLAKRKVPRSKFLPQ